MKTSWIVLPVLLFACGDQGEEKTGRGPLTMERSGKADGTSCKGYCGKQAPAGCWCDDQCKNYGDCCLDKEAECDKTCASVGGYCLPLTNPMGSCKPSETADNTPGLCGGALGQSTTCCRPGQAQTCADLTCPSGYHCEMKGINGGSIPVCIKDAASKSCKGYCGKKSPDGCWCDSQCDNYGDCCPDKQAECDAAKTCSDITCSAGYHCEMKGINGGSVPVCIKDAAKTCSDITCSAGYHCEMKGINGGSVPVCIKDAAKTCVDLGGYCLPLTYPMGSCKPGETIDNTPGLCDPLPGQSTTCCKP